STFRLLLLRSLRRRRLAGAPGRRGLSRFRGRLALPGALRGSGLVLPRPSRRADRLVPPLEHRFRSSRRRQSLYVLSHRRGCPAKGRSCRGVELLAIRQAVEAAVDPPRDFTKRIVGRLVGELVEAFLRPVQPGDSKREIG